MSYCRPSFASLALYPSLESVGLTAKLDRLRWAFTELERDPIAALESLPSRYQLSHNDLLSEKTFLDAGEIGAIYRYRSGVLKTFTYPSPFDVLFQVKRLASSQAYCHSTKRNPYANQGLFNPFEWIYRSIGVHILLEELGLAPKFLGYYFGDVSLFIPDSTAKIAYGMVEILEPIKLPEQISILDNSQKGIVKDFLETVLLVVEALNLTPNLDIQILFSLKDNRPYLIDFDLWSQDIARVSRSEYVNKWKKEGLIN
jgi:hypothetical protein